MADRKYASDYVLEEHILPNGKYQTIRVYRGPRYCFACGEAGAKRLGGRLLMAAAAILALLLPLLFNNTQLGRTFYVLLPMAFSLIPLYQLAAVGWRMRTLCVPLTRQERDLTEGRLKLALPWLAGMLLVNCTGCAVYWLKNGISDAGEIFCVLGLVLACSLAVWIRGWKDLARTEQTEKNP